MSDSRRKGEGWRGSKVFDHSCRNHGACEYCKDNRTFFDKKARTITKEELEEDV